jgi:hypothetical protein
MLKNKRDTATQLGRNAAFFLLVCGCWLRIPGHKAVITGFSGPASGPFQKKLGSQRGLPMEKRAAHSGAACMC